MNTLWVAQHIKKHLDAIELRHREHSLACASCCGMQTLALVRLAKDLAVITPNQQTLLRLCGIGVQV